MFILNWKFIKLHKGVILTKGFQKFPHLTGIWTTKIFQKSDNMYSHILQLKDLSQNNGEYCNCIPERKLPSDQTAGRVNNDSNAWTMPKIWSFPMVLSMCPNIVC
jgi:hypothetical protein